MLTFNVVILSYASVTTPCLHAIIFYFMFMLKMYMK